MMNADKIIQRFMDLQGRRTPWEGVWQQCADYVCPRMGKYNRTNQFIFDSTAPLALGRFGAAMESSLTPRSYRWHSLVTGNRNLDLMPQVSRYLEAVTDILFAARYAPEANFANQIMEAYLSLGVYGTAVMFIGDAPGGGPRYQNIPVHEVYLAENAYGVVDTVHREYKLTARQAVQEFGEDNLPDRVREDAADPVKQETKYHFIHAVFPRADYNKQRRDAANMPVASVHVECATRAVVRESGYRVMPYAVSRFQVTPGEIYGRSPAMDVMPDIVQVNAMKRTVLRAGEKMVDPPLLLPDDDLLRGFNLKAGSLNYGGLDDQGKDRVKPLQIDGKLPIGLELIEASRTVINDAYFLTLFQILVEKPGEQTATEVIQRAQEKAQLLAPAMGRQQSELLRPIIERELDILIATGAIPEAPPEMAQSGQAEVFPRYETTMAQALNSQDGTAIVQAFQAVGMLAQADPGVMDSIDLTKAAKEIWRSFGAPADIIRSDEELAAIQQAKAQQAQQQQQMDQAMALAQGAGGAAQALKGFAEAGQIMQGGNNGGAQPA